MGVKGDIEYNDTSWIVEEEMDGKEKMGDRGNDRKAVRNKRENKQRRGRKGGRLTLERVESERREVRKRWRWSVALKM